MISGDRSLSQGKKSAFWYTLEILREHFERIDIICPRSVGRPITLAPFPHTFLHPSPWSLLLQPRWILRKGRELIGLYGHDAMTVHEYPPFYNGVGALLLHRATRVPYALEIHHVVGYPAPSSPAEWAGRILSRLFLPLDTRSAAAVRVVSGEARSLLNRWGVPREKVHLVPSFYIETALWRPDPRVAKRYDLAFCGRLVANKGLPELLSVLRSLPGVSLLVVGDGPLRRACERRVQAWGLSSRVTFTGWLPSQEDVARALQSARVFIMNSRSEGGPRVALEAMAAGLPVVATRVGVMPDVIRDASASLSTGSENGFLVSMEPQSLIRAINLLLKDPSLCGRVGAEAAKIGERFERKAALEQYAKFLQSLTPRRDGETHPA
ncbi:MAG: glycosyltransferase family 4 protein [Candidatus Peribacteraceae bacterium]